MQNVLTKLIFVSYSEIFKMRANQIQITLGENDISKLLGIERVQSHAILILFLAL